MTTRAKTTAIMSVCDLPTTRRRCLLQQKTKQRRRRLSSDSCGDYGARSDTSAAAWSSLSPTAAAAADSAAANISDDDAEQMLPVSPPRNASPFSANLSDGGFFQGGIKTKFGLLLQTKSNMTFIMVDKPQPS